MKKTITYLLLLALPLFAVSCHKGQEGTVSKTKGEFYAEIPGDKSIVEIFPGASQVFSVRASAHGTKVSDVALNFELKVAPELVDVYNSENDTQFEMCPGSAFEITKGTLMMPRYGTASSTGKVKIVASGLEDAKTYILPLSLQEPGAGEEFVIFDTLAAYVIFKLQAIDIEKGIGTSEYPFMIYNVEEFRDIPKKCQDGITTFFKLANDIDMAGITDWTPITEVKIDLDGDGHSIQNFTSNASIFGAITGKIHDINITNAYVEHSLTSPIGVIASDFGAVGSPSVAEHVHVQGRLVNKKATGTGGLFGRVADATINACSADIEIVSNKYAGGGICGYDNSACTITNCWTSGSFDGTAGRYTGGIMGRIIKGGTQICNCYTTMRIIGHFYFGGILGNGNPSEKDNATNDPQNHIERCIAWNESVTSDINDGSTAEHYSGGAIVGYTALKNYHVDCYRKADFVFTDCPGNAGNHLIDQGNSSPDNPLVVGLEGTYTFPYHGKAAAADATVSSLAKMLGWNESIWDLSGDMPFFKGFNPPVVDPDVPADGQLSDFGENEFYK